MLSKKIVLLSFLSLLLNACAENKNHDDLYSEFCNYYLVEHPEYKAKSKITINNVGGSEESFYDDTEFINKFSALNLTRIEKSEIESYKKEEETNVFVYYFGYVFGDDGYFISVPYSNYNVIEIELYNHTDSPIYHYYATSESDIDLLINYCVSFLA